MSLLTIEPQRGLLAQFMNLLNKEDLQFKNAYSWRATGGDDPNYRGPKDRNRLNRSEGYEILDLLNSLAREQPGWTKRDSLIAEARIHHSNWLIEKSRQEWKDWLAHERMTSLTWA